MISECSKDTPALKLHDVTESGIREVAGRDEVTISLEPLDDAATRTLGCL